MRAGRLFPKLIPKALGAPPHGMRLKARFEEYQFHHGELVAGAALGYNFGDGYLHGSFLLSEVQKVCRFEEGECVQIFVDSCPLFGSKFPWCVCSSLPLSS